MERAKIFESNEQFIVWCTDDVHEETFREHIFATITSGIGIF